LAPLVCAQVERGAWAAAPAMRLALRKRRRRICFIGVTPDLENAEGLYRRTVARFQKKPGATLVA